MPSALYLEVKRAGSSWSPLLGSQALGISSHGSLGPPVVPALRGSLLPSEALLFSNALSPKPQFFLFSLSDSWNLITNRKGLFAFFLNTNSGLNKPKTHLASWAREAKKHLIPFWWASSWENKTQFIPKETILPDTISNELLCYTYVISFNLHRRAWRLFVSLSRMCCCMAVHARGLIFSMRSCQSFKLRAHSVRRKIHTREKEGILPPFSHLHHSEPFRLREVVRDITAG